MALVIKVPWYFFSVLSIETVTSRPFQPSIEHRRNYLVQKVMEPNFSPDSMPFYIPPQIKGEWAMGTMSMLAMALAQIAEQEPLLKDQFAPILDSILSRALEEKFHQFDSIAWEEDALDNLESSRGHLGYLGHVNLIIGAYRRVSEDSKWDALSIKISRAIMIRLGELCPVAETYPGEIYIPDVVAAVASLRWSKLETGEFLQGWVNKAEKSLVDQDTGLLAFGSDSNCRDLEDPRGTGAAWNSFFLPFISKQLAMGQFSKLEKHFIIKTFFGRAVITEWLRGREQSRGDVDSGPVLFGISPAGSVFSISAFLRYGKFQYASDLLKISEVLGFTVRWNERSHLLLAPLVVDAILLAMLTTPPQSL